MPKYITCPKCKGPAEVFEWGFCCRDCEHTEYQPAFESGERKVVPLAHLAATEGQVSRRLVAGATASIVLFVAIILTIFVVVRLPNATCSTCGYRFRISERYRGNNSEFTVDIWCPRCNVRWTPHTLYDRSEGEEVKPAPFVEFMRDFTGKPEDP